VAEQVAKLDQVVAAEQGRRQYLFQVLIIFKLMVALENYGRIQIAIMRAVVADPQE
jgi:hypothetical protein